MFVHVHPISETFDSAPFGYRLDRGLGEEQRAPAVFEADLGGPLFFDCVDEGVDFGGEGLRVTIDEEVQERRSAIGDLSP